MVNKGFPLPKELIRNEIATLDFFRDDKILWQYYTQFATKANDLYAKIKISHNFFDFESYLEIPLHRRVGKAYVGGLIVPSTNGKTYENVTYSLAICEKKSTGDVLLKKIHFDYTDPTQCSSQPHPVFHFQHPGELTPLLAKDGLKNGHLASWLSEPRLPFCPMSLAFLVNYIFMEFRSEHSEKFIQRGEWRRVIRKNEELLLEPYYRNCFRFVEKRRKKVIRGVERLLTSDFYYGKT